MWHSSSVRASDFVFLQVITLSDSGRRHYNREMIMSTDSTVSAKFSFINSAAKIILGGKKYDHVTDHLIKLHWLNISQILLLAFKALNDQE